MSLIAICSDSHDNLVNIKIFLDYCAKQGVKTLIHCGDVTKDATKKYFEENFDGEIYFVEGNADISEQDKEKRTNRFQRIKHLPVPFVELQIGEVNLAGCHKRDKAGRLAATQKYRYVFYGHTHKPWIEREGDTEIVNPGNLAGMFYPASFAVLNTDTCKIKLLILHNLYGSF